MTKGTACRPLPWLLQVSFFFSPGLQAGSTSGIKPGNATKQERGGGSKGGRGGKRWIDGVEEEETKAGADEELEGGEMKRMEKYGKGPGEERKGINGVKRREEGWWIKGGEN